MSRTSSSILMAAQLADARGGSREALGRALDRCRLYLLELARHALGPGLRPKGGASDLVQDTYLDAQRLFDRFDGSSPAQLRAWLRRLLLFRVSKFGRRYHGTIKRQLARERSLAAPQSTARPSQLPGRAPTPSVAAASAEQAERLRAAIGRLPDDYRRVMTLRYFDELPFDEVGRRLGRSAAAARMLWARAVERLKDDLAGEAH